MRKGYILVDVILAFTCLLMLSVPLFRTFELASRNHEQSNHDKELIQVMRFAAGKVQSAACKSNIAYSYEKDGYDINVVRIQTSKEKVYKYEIKIFEERKEKTKFYIYKKFDE